MKIYWRSKEGKPAPKNARFSIAPFSFGQSLAIPERCDHLPPPSQPILALLRSDSPSYDEWIKKVESSLQEIQSGRLQKVVLARQTTLRLPFAPDPFSIAAALSERSLGASLFCISFDEERSFLGASPERLYSRNAHHIEAESVAGTRKITETFEPLDKEIAEFQYVQDYLAKTLAPFCGSCIQCTERQIHKTATVQHLFSRCRGTLREIDDERILASLHPTPALCGTPRNQAHQWIAKTEPFQRGWYGGYVGWKTEEAADWTVSIRSCLIEGSTVKLFTGAGIVAGSDPLAEWEELEAKLSLYRGIFQWKS